MKSQIIAERNLLYCKKGSDKFNKLIIRIGQPYIDEEGVARCPVDWGGIFETFADFAGVDLVHALQLASDIDSLILKLSDKYDFYWHNGDPYFDEE